ncbi:hypothetical protein ACWT_0276 [Actinoplanes sp. SE50]|uniref:hypothetical protein n=1 Tax=unclassified Actinoplanes TaxID=2626549 RepID=UPI00023EC003|nr:MULTISPECIES: hypothetical protein [unclassified Actinoplanes]AEV81288.1 hypothetical protein ACPL_391 [Actinoplanes sp. SE50/110]ATO79691.1 hypothetical protein ACWT_0276 [Actinoplanes sp. SE50]SLL97094.1 hypothetical protein ACSP50_0290 [Actinoplanes sp. SE50/110]
MTGWDEGQLAAGFRSMVMLSALVERGGRPAPVAPTVRLRPAERQYGWFPADVDGDGRRVVVITSQRLIVGDREWSLRSITGVDSEPRDCTVSLRLRGRPAPLVLSGPWVPWLGVVICAELYQPVAQHGAQVPRQRGLVHPDLGLQRQRVVVPHPVHRGDRHPGATV